MQRLNYATASREALPKLQAVSAFVHHAGLDPKLLELIFLRASQINGCAWCLDFHSKRARQEFNDTDLTNLTIAVGMINLWNRLNVAFQTDLP